MAEFPRFNIVWNDPRLHRAPHPRAGGKMLLSQAGIGTIHVMGQSLRFWLPLGTGSTIQKRSNYTGWNTSPSTVSDRWDHNHRLSMSEFHGLVYSIPACWLKFQGWFNHSCSIHHYPCIEIHLFLLAILCPAWPMFQCSTSPGVNENPHIPTAQVHTAQVDAQDVHVVWIQTSAVQNHAFNWNWPTILVQPFWGLKTCHAR